MFGLCVKGCFQFSIIFFVSSLLNILCNMQWILSYMQKQTKHFFSCKYVGQNFVRQVKINCGNKLAAPSLNSSWSKQERNVGTVQRKEERCSTFRFLKFILSPAACCYIRMDLCKVLMVEKKTGSFHGLKHSNMVIG